MKTIYLIYFYSSNKTVRATVFGRFVGVTVGVALLNQTCAVEEGICVPNPNSLALIVSEISSTRLVILIKNIYTLWGRKRLILPVTYFLTKLVHIDFYSMRNG